jgi:cell division protein FtsQ
VTEHIKKHKKLILIFVILGVILFCVFFFRVKKVSFEGNTFYTEDKMAEMFQSNFLEKNLLSFWLMDKLSLTPNPAFVREYEVTYPSPNEIHIKLYEKTIIAGISYSNQYIYFDKDGMVLKSTDTPVENIPLFETKELTTFALYSKVQMEDEELLDQIMNLANLFNHYDVSWDKVEFTEEHEAVLYSGDIKVTLGKTDNYDERISALASILEQVIKAGKKGEFDMSNYEVKGTVIFNESGVPAVATDTPSPSATPAAE